MKTFRRIIALAIVLCTLGAMMIPGVSVNAAAPTSKTFDIKADSVAAGISYGSGNRFWSDGTCQTNMNNYYATSGWNIYKNDSGATLYTTYPPRFYKNGLQFYPNAVSKYAYAVAKFVAPGTGDYILSLKPSVISSSDERAEQAGAYILPYGNYDKWTLPGVTSEAAAAGSKVTLNETQLREQVFHNGEGAVALVEGVEYLLVFYCYDSTSKTAKADYQAFQLTGVAKYDYTVTYHANYEGATNDKVVDDENVVDSTDATKTIGIDSIAYNRPSNFIFGGWATEANGNVVYKPGDQITLTAEKPTADLYAVWWNTEDNGDLIVDFRSQGTGLLLDWNTASELMVNISNSFSTNKWKVYSVEGGAYDNAASYLRRNSNSYGNHGINIHGTGGIHLQFNTARTTDAIIPIEFEAPGTGVYKLSFTVSRIHRLAEGGAYIVEIPEGGFASITDIPAPDSEEAMSLVNIRTNESNNDDMFTYEATSAVALDRFTRYALVLYCTCAEGYDDGYLRFRDFSLTEAPAAAYVGSTPYYSFAEALAAAGEGKTIKLNADVTYNGSVDLGAAVLDLNGYVITADAVVGSVKDTTGGDGRIAASQDSILSSAANDLVIWDNTTDAEGYRVFSYTFESVRVDDDQDVATAVNKFIDLYQTQRVLAGPENLDKNGEVVKGKGDQHFKDVADDIAALYEAGSVDWRFEYTSQTYQMSRGGVCFSWGNTSIRQYGTGYMAIRIHAPADGKVSVNLKTASEGNDTKNAGFDMYILKASEVEALAENYGAAYDAYLASLATIASLATQNEKTAACVSNELNTAISTVMDASAPVITGISNGSAYTGSYEFEADNEYIVVFKNNGSVKDALYMYFKNISFTREAKDADARTFWSYLEFSNKDAYALVAASGLKVGFNMDWNGDWKDFEFDPATVNAWADKVVAEPETDWGFYIRVSGFEKLAESGTLTATPYIEVKNERVDADPLTFNYELPAAE